MSVVIVVWLCSSSWLAFLTMANLINLMQNLFLSPLSYLRWRQSFSSCTFFFKKMNFCGFSICTSFGRHLCQKCGWAVRKFMCKRTLPRLLVDVCFEKISSFYCLRVEKAKCLLTNIRQSNSSSHILSSAQPAILL